MEKIIQYCGQKAKVACDERCDKAWGMGRPRFYPEIGKDKIYGYGQEHYWPENDPGVSVEFDEDDYGYLPDDELGIAPIDPGTYEGGHGKPTSPGQMMNKWCVIACERCAITKPGKWAEPLELPDFSVVRYNYHSRNSN